MTEKTHKLRDEQFERAKEKIIGIQRQRQGIGTLSEKTTHAIFKNFYAPDEDMHEIPIENFVADIYTGTEIIEIQTRQFNKMRDKLTAFLPLYPVTIVHPIPREKWLYWIDEETGDVSKGRKSPRRGTAYEGFVELYKIKMFLKDPNIRIKLVLTDMEEYKLLNGWSGDKKKGATRYDRIPLKIAEEIDIECLQDYMQFIPYDLPEPFTVKTFAKAAKINNQRAQVVTHILNYVGVIERVGKEGNAFLYRVSE